MIHPHYIIFFYIGVIFPIDFPIFKKTLCQVLLSCNRMFPGGKSSIYRVTTQPITITTENNFQFIVSSCSLYGIYHVQIISQTILKMPFTLRAILLTCFSSSSCKNTRRGSTNIFAYRKYELIHMKVCIILLKYLDEKTPLASNLS